MTERVRLYHADECEQCPDCGEPVCPRCEDHYADCPCPGPANAEELGWRLVEEDDVLYGEREVSDSPAA